jgi:hypothetical protein
LSKAKHIAKMKTGESRGLTPIFTGFHAGNLQPASLPTERIRSGNCRQSFAPDKKLSFRKN